MEGVVFRCRHAAGRQAIYTKELGKMSDAAPLELAVLRFADGWRILAEHGRWGRFAYRVDAEEAAIRLAHKARAQGREVHIWVQGLCGHLQLLDAA